MVMVIIMNNKVLVELLVPSLDERYNVYFPINRRVGNIIELLNKALAEKTDGVYRGNEKTMLYDSNSGNVYDVNSLIRNTNIRNGSIVILL